MSSEDRTFYCDACARERRWPIQLIRTRGECVFCGKETMGNNPHNSVLPDFEKFMADMANMTLFDRKGKPWQQYLKERSGP